MKHRTSYEEKKTEQTFDDIPIGGYAVCHAGGLYEGAIILRRENRLWLPLSNPIDSWTTAAAGANKCRVLMPGDTFSVTVG